MKNKTIQLVGIDLDGTLLNHHFELTPTTIETYNRAIHNGLQISIVTGRDKLSAQPFLDQLDLGQAFIGSGGAQIWLNGLLVSQTSFSLQQTIDIIALGSEYGAGMYIDQEQQTLRFGARTYTDLFGHVSQSMETDHIDDVLTELPIKISLIQEPSVLDELRVRLSNQYPGLTMTSPFQKVLDVNPVGCNKGIALKKLAIMLDVRVENIAVIGDSENDLSMFAITKHSYAMGNANEKVCRSATNIAPSNIENGVAKVLERIMQENKSISML